MNSQLRRVTIVLSLLVPLAAHAANLKFHAATGTEPVIGRYLVTLDTSIPADQASASAEALARAYHGQLEPFASSEIRQFAIAMLPGRARTLSADPRVREVVEIAQSDGAPSPPPANSSATLTGHLTPITRDVSSSGTYLYDGSGNIKFIGSDSFVYDVDGRLMRATVQANQQSYTYDAFGNRVSATRAAGAAGCVGGCEAVVTVNHQTNHLTEQTYDEAGNVASGFGAAYTYDGTGMVTRATVGSDDRIFVYTADDERLAVRNGVSWTWTVRGQGNKVLREFTSLETSASPLVLNSHTWAKDYVWRDGLLLASVFQSTSGPTTYHYHLDHLGTPRMITASSGVLVAKHTYYPFGAEMDIAPHESATEAMKFTGHERDIVAANNASVDYMHARYYNPNMERFLSVDPVLETDKASVDPQRWNRYTYAIGNPMKYTDPTGREIYLQTHHVVAIAGSPMEPGVEFNHMSVRIEPVDQQRWASTPRFRDNINPATGRHYATLGAGPENSAGSLFGRGGRLVAKFNRPTDVDLRDKISVVSLNLKGRNENDVIASLIGAQATFMSKPQLSYELFPSLSSAGYNSNSYVAGLLRVVNLDLPAVALVPGVDKPVPGSNFK
jgi:RHS repeat-associated protein